MESIHSLVLHDTHVLRRELLPAVAQHCLAQRLDEVLPQKTEVSVQHRGWRAWNERLYTNEWVAGTDVQEQSGR